MVKRLSGAGFRDRHFTPETQLFLTKLRVFADANLPKEQDPEFTLDRDIAPVIFSKLVGHIEDDQLLRLQPKLCFYMEQLHVIKSANCRARVFLLLGEVFAKWPRETLLLIFLNIETVWNITQLYSDFSVVPFECEPFVRYPGMHQNVHFFGLYQALFVWQFLHLLSLCFDQGFVLQEIHANICRYSQGIDAAIHEQAVDIENSFHQAPGQPSLAAHCAVIPLLVRCKPALITSIFTNPGNSFLLWLGRVVLAAPSYRMFARIANCIRKSAEAQTICVAIFFGQSARPSTLAHLPALARISSFVGDLIRMQPTRPYPFRPIVCSSSVLNALQLLPLEPMRVLDLIEAISRFYVQQVETRGRPYRDSFGEFRMSFLPLFLVKLTPSQIIALLKAIQWLLFPYGKDKSNFVNDFIFSLFPLMGSSHGPIANMAWQVFRQWILCDPAPEKAILSSQNMKNSLLALAEDAEDKDSARGELARLREGIVASDPKVNRIMVARNRRASGIFGRIGLAEAPGALIIELLNGVRKEPQQ
jgi:hypothetical protein